ncbi:hypothetical protein CEXT_18051 [Caerostris extrusa]|uniref:Uncharacterized protein n=1 Tax=Caerostris extrusa TaxID=172846 RepID=A0AAV4QFN3_CAEEX|nr:hypothetical protein CEXT_18051 [Caerostris extrusa]
MAEEPEKLFRLMAPKTSAPGSGITGSNGIFNVTSIPWGRHAGVVHLYNGISDFGCGVLLLINKSMCLKPGPEESAKHFRQMTHEYHWNTPGSVI